MTVPRRRKLTCCGELFELDFQIGHGRLDLDRRRKLFAVQGDGHVGLHEQFHDGIRVGDDSDKLQALLPVLRLGPTMHGRLGIDDNLVGLLVGRLELDDLERARPWPGRSWSA